MSRNTYPDVEIREASHATCRSCKGRRKLRGTSSPGALYCCQCDKWWSTTSPTLNISPIPIRPGYYGTIQTNPRITITTQPTFVAPSTGTYAFNMVTY